MLVRNYWRPLVARNRTPPWNDEQLAHIDRTLQQAVGASMKQHRTDLLWWHKLATAVTECNSKSRLNVLNGLTPQEYVLGRIEGNGR